MVWPRDPREHPHQHGSGDAIGGVVRERDWKKSKHQWMSRAPEPDILMENVERRNGKREEHCLGLHVSTDFRRQDE